jgi:hypothetical protein
MCKTLGHTCDNSNVYVEENVLVISMAANSVHGIQTLKLLHLEYNPYDY